MVGGSVGLLAVLVRTRRNNKVSVVVVVIIVFTVVCFFVVHPRGGGRGRVRGFHGDVAPNISIMATKNVCNGMGRIGSTSGALVIRVTSNIGVGVTGSSIFTDIPARATNGWSSKLFPNGAVLCSGRRFLIEWGGRKVLSFFVILFGLCDLLTSSVPRQSM